MNGGTLSDHVHYPYVHPDHGNILFWHCRARVSGDPTRRKHFWYLTADPEFPGRWAKASKEHPGPVARPCLYNLPILQSAVRKRWDVPVLWAEGEKDARTANLSMGVRVAVSHHGGAGHATEEQAEHFRGYRGPVIVAADRDDAGAACALKRYRLLRKVGVRPTLVRPADGVLAGGGGCGVGVVCECEPVCPPPAQAWRGADLSDHEAAGYGLRDLVRVRPRDLAPAAERSAARQQHGWAYGDAEEREQARNSPLVRDGAPWARKRSA